MAIRLAKLDKPRFSWALKQWEVYTGDFYLGSIIKREYGPGTPLRLKKQKTKEIGFQIQPALFSAPNIGVKIKRLNKVPTLLDAKNEFKRICEEFIDSVNQQ